MVVGGLPPRDSQVPYQVGSDAPQGPAGVPARQTNGPAIASLVCSCAPERWEWSPLYFKEISWVGSNAFGIEEVEGVRLHGIEHYLRLVEDGRIDLTGMLTHTFRLDQWREAFTALATQQETGAVKVAFDFR